MKSYEAVVVGAGLVGLAAASVAADAGLHTLHVAPRTPPDRRTSALMRPNVEYLRQSGLIDDTAVIGHPLCRLRIIDATDRLIRAPETLFEANELGLDAFGWNFPNAALIDAFGAAGADRANLERLETSLDAMQREATGWRLHLANGDSIHANLVIGADGKQSGVRAATGIQSRERAYSQSALVCDLELDCPVDTTSVEFHYPSGPFTFVPAGGTRTNLVWIDDSDVLQDVRRAGTAALDAAILDKSQRLFGNVRSLTPAVVFPLSSLTVDRAGKDAVVLVGESAHAFPPIGAQGLNLGLRDVADLALSIAGTDRQTRGWGDCVARNYAQRRANDLRRTHTVVDTVLFRSLLSEMLPAHVGRAAGLWALKLVPPLRRRAFALGMGNR